MIKTHKVERLNFEKDQMRIVVDGKTLAFSLKKISRRLLKASLKERNRFEISSSGYGIHWPLIDEDLSVEALLRSN